MIFREEDVGGRERVTTDEERVARGAEQSFKGGYFVSELNELSE